MSTGKPLEIEEEDSSSSFTFNFDLPFASNSKSYFNESGAIKFDPPVYEQRYAITLRILEHEIFANHIKSVSFCINKK